MAIWDTREQSIKFLNEWHPSKVAVMEQAVALCDDIVDAFETATEEALYARVCAITLLKGKSYALSSYSVILDGHGHEAGALLRPMIEYAELLTYLRQFPQKAELAIEDKLPSAGNRAKALGTSIYENLRKYLNEHASHSAFSEHAIKHLVDFQAQRLRKNREFAPKVLLTNLDTLVQQVLVMLQEAIRSLERTNALNVVALADRLERLKSRTFDVFGWGDRFPAEKSG
jgi:hypothetical protein